MGMFDDYKPADLGFDPDKFPEYRDIQKEFLDWAVSSDRWMLAACIPGGGGKSLSAVSLSRALQARTCILTPFIDLEKQYMSDFENLGMVNIHGRSNYDCMQFDHLDCRGGASLKCEYVGGKGCTYEQEKAIAKESQLVTTNYAYWLTVNDKATGIERNEKETKMFGGNSFELLVCDEAHLAVQAILNYVSCSLYEERDLRRFGTQPSSTDVGEWSRWAKDTIPALDDELRTTGMELEFLGKKAKPYQLKTLHELEQLRLTLTKLSEARGTDWVIECETGGKYGRVWKFDCVFAGLYSRQYLLCGVPKVLLLSATLHQKTLWDLGIGKDDYDYRQWDRIFPANRHKIMITGMPTTNAKGEPSIQTVDRKTTPEKLESLVHWMDQNIIKPRLDRKGLICTMAYDWQRTLVEYSEYSDIMIRNTADANSDTAYECAEQFREADPPALLVSPSFSTGWDFKGRQCEYIIIFKAPLVPGFSRIAKARLQRDPRYLDYLGVQILEQSALRGMRFELDRCEVFIIDGHARWFVHNNRDLMSGWFPKAVQYLGSKVPPPPERVPA